MDTLDVVKFSISTLSAIVSVARAVSVFFLRRSENRLETAKEQIINYLREKDLKMISMDGIRKYINNDYKDDFLRNLPDYFPQDVRRALLNDSGGQNTIPGLAR